MADYILFFLVILLANIIQGITGFAGTILAMPPSLMLVGYPVAKPVLNILALVSGSYVFFGNRKNVCWKELKKIVLVMAVGILAGILIQGLFFGREQLLYKLLGIFVILLACQGGFNTWKGETKTEKATEELEAENKQRGRLHDSPVLYLLLILAGIVHGIFVSGGPLLISYLTKKIHDKTVFRATISTVWIFLNSMILVDDLRSGLWDASLVVVFLISVPFLLAGMMIGSYLYARMSQKLFMKLTYILLFISGISLLIK